jgi:hypothetical protein
MDSGILIVLNFSPVLTNNNSRKSFFFRPSAAHLPKPVAIPFPEQRAAVAAQIKFAEQEDRLRAAASSRTSEVVRQPLLKTYESNQINN